MHKRFVMHNGYVTQLQRAVIIRHRVGQQRSHQLHTIPLRIMPGSVIFAIRIYQHKKALQE